MTIALAKDVEEFLQEQVRAGVCADASELANAVLRSVRDQQRKPFEVTPELEAWLLEAADQPTAPLTQADFDGIRQRVELMAFTAWRHSVPMVCTTARCWPVCGSRSSGSGSRCPRPLWMCLGSGG